MAENPPHLPSAAADADREERLVETVPEEVREAARRAFAERDRQADIMALGYDSLLADSPANEPRCLTFADPTGAEVAVTVRAAPSGDEVLVELTSFGCSLVEVRCGGATFPVDTADRAVVGPAPHGLFSAVLERADLRRLRTSWIRV